MYPKVFTDYAAAARKYGPVAVLPTPVFFYGMEPRRRGQRRHRARQDADRAPAGDRRRPTRRARSACSSSSTASRASSRVPNRVAVAKLPARRKAEDGNDAHVAAPMPGTVATVAVRAGQPVKAGDVLLTIEAMKMETALHAPKGRGGEGGAGARGQPVDAKDLLVVLEG